MQRFFIIIPVHNRKQATLSCLTSLSSQTYHKTQIIVVDDGSTDGTADAILTNFPETIILRGDGNLWWTAATNLGVNYVLKHAKADDFILTLNNDTFVEPEYIDILRKSILANPKSLIGSIVLNDEDCSTVVDGGVRVNWYTAKYIFLGRGKNYNEVMLKNTSLIPVDFLPGRGTLIPIEVFRKMGLYDSKKLPHYAADYEFAWRAKKKGYNLFVNYDAKVMSNVASTGINNEINVLSWGELMKSFFSIKSPYNIYYRWNFARLTCPKVLMPLFFSIDIGRVIWRSLRKQFQNISNAKIP